MTSGRSSGSETVARHRVVIVGFGFGGLWASKALRRVDVDVTIIDRTNHHLFQPLLYQMATGILSEGDIAPPIREIVRRQRNARVLLGEGVDIDVEARELGVAWFEARSRIGYDTLVLATGARQSYFGHDELAIHAPGMKSIDDALELRGRIFGAFEMAESEPDASRRRALMTFVVVGGGPTGVEMAGQIAELAKRSLRRNFRVIDPAEARVLLLDAGPALLATFPPTLQGRVAKDLERLGVEVHLNTMVTGVDAQGVLTSSDDPALRRIDAAAKIWAAGVEASPLGRMVAADGKSSVDRTGRLQVAPDCTVPGHPEIFAIGDLMSLEGLPGVAEVAMQSGAHAARTIARRLRGDTEPKPFKYRDLGDMATISRFRAIATIGPLKLWGFIGWLAWLLIHLVFLTGFKSRVAVVFNWAIAFIGRGRPQRTITTQQVIARQVLAHRQTDEGQRPHG